MSDDYTPETLPDYMITGHPAQVAYDKVYGEPSPRYRPFYLYGHTLLVQRCLGRWTWCVEFADGSSIEGWTFSKRGAYRACFHAVPRG